MITNIFRLKLGIGLILGLMSLTLNTGCTCLTHEKWEFYSCVVPGEGTRTSPPYRCTICGNDDDPGSCEEIARRIDASLCGVGALAITSLEPACIEAPAAGITSQLKINGTGLSQVISIGVRPDLDVAHNDVFARILQVTDSQITASISISSTADSGRRFVSVFKSDGSSSNEWIFRVNGCEEDLSSDEILMQSRLMRSVPVSKRLDSQLLAQADTSRLILTPVADGTVLQTVVRNSQAGLPDIVNTVGPATSARVAQVSGTPLNVVGRTTEFNFQGYGLGTGGLLDFSGTTLLGEFSKTLPLPPLGTSSLTQSSSATVGVVEFDLNNLKAALQQLNLNASAVRATLRLTPIRSLDLFDLTGVPSTPLPSTTHAVLLEMTQNQKDLTVDYKDFPGFTSPGISSLRDLAAVIDNAPPEHRATVRTDLLGLPAPLVFDVTGAVQRDLQTTRATTGFQIASELNGTGLLFADSANYIPGISEMIAPQLIIELVGFASTPQERLVTSATRVPFDSLALGFTNMTLVTVNNLGASPATVSIDLTSGANVFGLLMPDGRPLSLQGNTATIGGGDSMTFGVTFKPPDGQGFKGEVQVTDTTGGKRELINKIALTGSTLLVGFSRELPTITAPVKSMPLPDQAARTGDLNWDGLIDAADISRLSAFINGRLPKPSPGTAAFAVADINGNGAIQSNDLSILCEALAQNRSALPRLRP